MSEGGQRAQTSNYKINRFWGCDVQHGDQNYQYTAYLKVANRGGLKSFHRKKKKV